MALELWACKMCVDGERNSGKNTDSPLRMYKIGSKGKMVMKIIDTNFSLI